MSVRVSLWVIVIEELERIVEIQFASARGLITCQNRRILKRFVLRSNGFEILLRIRK